MYSEFFKLTEPPFSLTPDPRFLFMSERHREGLAHLVYGIQQPGGFVQLTGEVGSGKTTLCRCLVRQLPPETDTALILNPRLTALELLASICDELSVPYPPETRSIKVLVNALNERLLHAHGQGRRTVLIIDEAQNLSSDVLEQIRLLTNLETSQEKLLQIILIGQPELLSILRRRKLRQLSQRITARYHLSALSRRETYAYIRYRLSVAGVRDPVFTAPSMRAVYRLSRGVPRLINVICDRALLGAYALDKRSVSAAIVRRASRESRGFVPVYRRLRLGWKTGGAACAAILTGGIFFATTDLSLFRRDSAAVAGSAAGNVGNSNAADPAKKTEGTSNNKPRAAITEEKTAASVTLKDGNSPGLSNPREPTVEAAKADDRIPLAGRSGSGGPPAGLRLADILADPALRGSSNSSFTSLYARLGLKGPLTDSTLGCSSARDQGFECLFRVGNWTKLRYFDLPALLELTLPTGLHQRVTLVGLGSETARLAIGGREYTFPLAEIDRVWDGSFILLWKLPFASRQISAGTRGKEVVWIRQALDTLESKDPSPEASDLYDETLRQRVMAFQRERSLPQDGSVGNATLVRLTLALRGPDAPSISRNTP